MRTLAILPFLLLTGCPISGEKAAERWVDWVQEHNACEVAEDCTVVAPGCPLGCATAVAGVHEAEAGEVADDLIAAYERAGRSCAYDCLEPPAVACDAGACVFVE